MEVCGQVLGGDGCPTDESCQALPHSQGLGQLPSKKLTQVELPYCFQEGCALVVRALVPRLRLCCIHVSIRQKLSIHFDSKLQDFSLLQG